MKKFYLSILAMCLAVTAQAQQRTDEELQEIAAQQLLTAGVKAQIGGQQAAVQDIREMSKTENLAIYGSEEAGFVVMARDSRLKPILGISLNTYTPGNEPDGFKWWLAEQEKALTVSTARMNIGAKGPGIIDETTDEEEGKYAPVDNFINTKWGQNSPYNDLCPKVGGKSTPSGCVATAMSQILRYNKYPTYSTGKGSYTTGTTQTSIPVMLNSTFDYDVMVNNYSYGKRSEASKTAVATLMRDCGYAANMEYTVSGSGTSDYDAAVGLTRNLGYDTLAITLLYRDFYTSEEWMEIINEEIQAKRPVLYSGSDKKYGGHAFLFSGIDAQGKFYVNWGWDGTSDGYFEFSNLTPRDILGYSVSYNFNEGQSVILGFTPDGQPLEGAEHEDHMALVGNFSLSSKMPNNMYLYFPGMYNLSYLIFYGETYLAIENEDDPEDYQIYRLFDTSEQSFGPLEPGYGVGEREFPLDLNELKPGNYAVNFISHAVNSDYYYYIRSEGGLYSAHFSKDANGKITVKESTLYDAIKDITTIQTESTDSQSANNKAFANKWYDLTGRQVSQPSQGLYIINGQKVMIK